MATISLVLIYRLGDTFVIIWEAKQFFYHDTACTQTSDWKFEMRRTIIMYIIREQSRERARESDTVKTKEHMCAAEISNHCSVGFVFVRTTSHHSKIHVPNVFYSVMFDTLAYKSCLADECEGVPQDYSRGGGWHLHA